ncbi:MAG: hypothetical protein ACPLSP_03170, partial [Fervidicoccus fontis]
LHVLGTPPAFVLSQDQTLQSILTTLYPSSLTTVQFSRTLSPPLLIFERRRLSSYHLPLLPVKPLSCEALELVEAATVVILASLSQNVKRFCLQVSSVYKVLF